MTSGRGSSQTNLGMTKKTSRSLRVDTKKGSEVCQTNIVWSVQLRDVSPVDKSEHG